MLFLASFFVWAIATGGAAYAGFILGMYETDRRNALNVYHEGAIILALTVVCIVSVLIVYGWLGSFWSSLFLPRVANPTKVYTSKQRSTYRENRKSSYKSNNNNNDPRH